MSKTLATVFLAATVTLSFAWQSTTQVVRAESAAKSKVVTKGKGHPEREMTAVAVHQTAKPKPAPKAEKATKTLRAGSSWVPGDYYWNGDDWQWADGYLVDQPWPDAIWVAGHWSDRLWGWTWVPGYWL